MIHQRIDEATVLWRSVKRTAGPILEVGRAAGGSTIVILGASGDRTVVSIDRAPTQPEMTKAVFSRPDVQSRLKLYNQSSREEIAEREFGMMFIDGDHSYEGVCHDIAYVLESPEEHRRQSPDCGVPRCRRQSDRLCAGGQARLR